MLKTYAHDFVGINRILRGIANLLAYVDEVKRQAPQKHPEDLINPEQAMSEIEETTRKAAALCTELGLRSAYRQLERVAKEIKYYQTDQARVASELAEIAQRIEDDLREAYFLFVPLSKLPFYNAPFYGEEVASRFPECRDDAIEAGGDVLPWADIPALCFTAWASFKRALRRLLSIWESKSMSK